MLHFSWLNPVVLATSLWSVPQVTPSIEIEKSKISIQPIEIESVDSVSNEVKLKNSTLQDVGMVTLRLEFDTSERRAVRFQEVVIGPNLLYSKTPTQNVFLRADESKAHSLVGDMGYLTKSGITKVRVCLDVVIFEDGKTGWFRGFYIRRNDKNEWEIDKEKTLKDHEQMKKH
jgi:hypothetical protein